MRYFPESGDLVRLRSSPDYLGRVVMGGDEQSWVKWVDGWEGAVVNSWIEKTGEGNGKRKNSERD